jgi:hypothetical protein
MKNTPVHEEFKYDGGRIENGYRPIMVNRGFDDFFERL